MAREFRHGLADMLSAIAAIEMLTTGKSLDNYHEEIGLRLAIERAIEIISEASRTLPDEITALRPEIAWREIRAIGNVMRHEYHHIAADVIWAVVVKDVPPLRAALEFIQELTRDKGDGD